MAEILGSGVAFPLQVDRRGGIALSSDQTDVDQAIHLILSTAKGERPMRPDFGCPIHDHVFAPADASIIGMLGFEVRNSLTMWEPRIDVLDVTVSQDDSRPSLLYIDITYEVRDTNDPRNLVFPFYAIPDEE
jgi:uncharacterized protein